MTNIPVRHTPRANWHKYNGAEYFVTICTGGREHYFGEVHDGQTQLTAVGECLRAQIENVQNHYPYATIPLYVIMPNHTHLIVVIDGDKTPYDRTVCRDAACHVRNDSGANDVTDAARDVNADAARDVPTGKNVHMQNVANRQGWLSVCIGGIKSAVTRFARENGIPFAWQSRYHDRIVRNQNEMNRIAEYIEHNPLVWESDCYNE
ncbi:MAG: transposase [Salinivirgaceae bacterium]|nr:transposase [Salinivirgaceae bacterium]